MLPPQKSHHEQNANILNKDRIRSPETTRIKGLGRETFLKLLQGSCIALAPQHGNHRNLERQNLPQTVVSSQAQAGVRCHNEQLMPVLPLSPTKNHPGDSPGGCGGQGGPPCPSYG